MTRLARAAVHAAFRRMAFETDLQKPSAERLELASRIGGRLAGVLERGREEGTIGPDPHALLCARGAP